MTHNLGKILLEMYLGNFLHSNLKVLPPFNFIWYWNYSQKLSLMEKWVYRLLEGFSTDDHWKLMMIIKYHWRSVKITDENGKVLMIRNITPAIIIITVESLLTQISRWYFDRKCSLSSFKKRKCLFSWKNWYLSKIFWSPFVAQGCRSFYNCFSKGKFDGKSKGVSLTNLNSKEKKNFKGKKRSPTMVSYRLSLEFAFSDHRYLNSGIYPR
jgi:hypothetical protein